MSKDILLYPRLIRSTPLVGESAEKAMRERVQEVVQDLEQDEKNNTNKFKISIVIRTLNEIDDLRRILDDIDQQKSIAQTEVIVVDNESTDGTPELAKKYGAKIISLAREGFTYPRSMNLGVEAASNDLVFLTVGHVGFSNRYLLAGAARHFENEKVGGVFAFSLLGENASKTEKLLKARAVKSHLKPAFKIRKASMGVLGATGCMFSKEVWNSLGKFDESYEIGGEDLALAKKMLENGYDIVEDPVASVHHSHGLGPINYARQVARWFKSTHPNTIDLKELRKGRPDRNFS